MKNKVYIYLLIALAGCDFLFAGKTDFPPLPANPIVGYWENWGQSMKLTDIPEEYNIIIVSFMLTEADDYTPVFDLDASCYLYGGGGGVEQFKTDIKTVQKLMRPVTISIGGETGSLTIDTQDAEDTFVAGVIEIIDEYDFDGLDIDLEGSSMNFNDSSNPGSFAFEDLSPQLQHTISAFRRIHDHYGNDFILTAAPELAYVQYGGVSGYYAGYTGKEGSFLPILENLRNEFDMVNIQYYNYGTKTWIPYTYQGTTDWNGFTTGTIDALAQLVDYFLYGFDISNLGIHFDGWPAEKTGIGLPSTPSSAGIPISTDPDGYYMHTNEVYTVLNYLTEGIRNSSFTFSMTDDRIYPKLKGMMTWDINHDATTEDGTPSYEFCTAYSAYFDKLDKYDSNDDGLPDRWELIYFGNINVNASAMCSNEVNTMQEACISGIDPTNQTSFFEIDQCCISTNNIISWNSYQGRIYSLWCTTNLADGFATPVATNIPWYTSVYTDTVYFSEECIFYRVNVKLSD
jgi:chitinase